MKKPTAVLAAALTISSLCFTGNAAALGVETSEPETTATVTRHTPELPYTQNPEEAERSEDGDEQLGADGGTDAAGTESETPAGEDNSADDAADGTDADAVDEGQSPSPEPSTTESPDPEAANEGENAEDLNDVEVNPLATPGDSAARSFAAPTQLGSNRVSTRLAGNDRFSTAIALSKHSHPQTADTAFVAMGLDYPDSLSAAPVAAAKGAPLLLSHSTALTASTAAELRRLKPKTIVLVGGTGVLNQNVENAAKQIAGKVVRIGGADRYETSLALIRYGWSKTAGVFVASGNGYADALSAGSAAGATGLPVLLVPGTASAASTNTLNTLKALGVTKLSIAGGTGSVSTAMEQSLKQGATRTVARYGGSDRYETSARIVTGTFPGAPSVYLASGMDFPDALGATVAAGKAASPLLLVQQNCIPSTVYTAHDRVKPQRTFVVGGTGVMGAGVLNGNECLPGKPSFIDQASWDGIATVYRETNALRYGAGVSGARLKENVGDYPAFRWSKTMSTAGYQHNPNVYKNLPWAQGENIAWSTGYTTVVSSGTAIAGFWRDSPAHYKNVTSVWAGKRTLFSVGFFRAKDGRDYATLIVGY